MNWIFGGEDDRAAQRARTPSGKTPPQLCGQCRALKKECQCVSGVVVAKDGTRTCKRCARAVDACTCPDVWGRRELALRATLTLDTRVGNMLAFLEEVDKSLDSSASHADTYSQLIAHGRLLLGQEQLLEAQRNKGVLTENVIEQHMQAVGYWMQLSDEQLGVTMRQIDLSALRDAIRQNSAASTSAATQHASASEPAPRATWTQARPHKASESQDDE